MIDINEIKFDEAGLVPAVIKDFYSGRVLTVAYMNRESLEITINEKRSCFWSRSRKELWRKGETSGNTQRVVSITADCDNDALLVEVIKEGPACHLGTESCFTNPVFHDDSVKGLSLDALYELILERKEKKPEGSYTAYLFNKGIEKILKKTGEECSEVIIAAMKGNKDEIVYETADLCYHVLVMMAQSGITVGDIKKELSSRHSTPGARKE
ncbi:MAG: bifunctional phosphoribosyl-AMP cyclohydrolase/phosphoribosyl-ATP diphosphatase HisIE [Oscillospiraceae bacterium]|nr:bifunctional phosphoribosyl-AMP cyclohydrolase/phosphoribosyl-ATP diphosphatase HisIE [Oscillospiraceae bacterium]